MLKIPKPEDITPKEITIIPKRDKILTVEPGEDISATIGGVGTRLASTVTDAINQDGNLVNDVINTKLDTDAKEILGEFTFGASGAIAIATDANNGLWISPTGILAKKLGANTLTITSSGDVTMVGTVTASAGYIGGWQINPGNLTGGVVILNSTGLISVGSGNNIFKADNNGIYLGNATFGLAPFRVDMTGHITATDITLTGYIPTGGAASDVNAGAVTVSGGKITATSIAADRLNVSTLSSITGNVGTLTAGTIQGCTIKTSTNNERVELVSDTIKFYVGNSLKATLDGSSAGNGGVKNTGDFFIANNKSYWITSSGGGSNEYGGIGITNANEFWLTLGTANTFFMKSNNTLTNYFTVSSANGAFSSKNGYTIGRWFNNGGSPINAGSGIFYTYTTQSFAAGWTAGSIDYTTIGALDFTSETFGIWPSIETTVQSDFVCHTYNYSTTGFQYIVHNPTAGNVTLTVRFLVFGR
jgi:hypothetical protein